MDQVRLGISLLGGDYSVLAGRDASRALATGELPTFVNANYVQPWDPLTDLTPAQRSELNDWIDFFYAKYGQVGSLVQAVQPEGSDHEDFTGHIMNI